MAFHVPQLDGTGRTGITQIVDGQRVVLVMPAADGGPGEVTTAGFYQAAAGWAVAINGLVDAWRRRVSSGEQATAITQRRAHDLRVMGEVIAELQSTGALQTFQEIAARGGDYSQIAGAARVAALRRAAEIRDEVGEVLAAPLEALSDFGDSAGWVANAALVTVALYGGAKIIGAVRGR